MHSDKHTQFQRCEPNLQPCEWYLLLSHREVLQDTCCRVWLPDCCLGTTSRHILRFLVAAFLYGALRLSAANVKRELSVVKCIYLSLCRENRFPFWKMLLFAGIFFAFQSLGCHKLDVRLPCPSFLEIRMSRCPRGQGVWQDATHECRVPGSGIQRHSLFWKHSFVLNGKSVFTFLKCSQTREKGKTSFGSESIETREKKEVKSASPNNLSSLIPPSGHWAHLEPMFWKIKWIFHLTSCIPEYASIQSSVSESQKVHCPLSCLSLQRNCLSKEMWSPPWNIPALTTSGVSAIFTPSIWGSHYFSYCVYYLGSPFTTSYFNAFPKGSNLISKKTWNAWRIVGH